MIVTRLEPELREETKKALAALVALLVTTVAALAALYVTFQEMIRAIDGD